MKPMANDSGNVTEFGPETEFDGVLNFTDNLVISGIFNGTIRATGNLEVSGTASCTVDRMTARSVVVSGRVTGDIEGSERVELCKGCVVRGNIRTANLRIAENVEFEGEVSMIEDAPEVDLFAVASAEYKDALIKKVNDAR